METKRKRRQRGCMGQIYGELKEIQEEMEAGRFGKAAHRIDKLAWEMEQGKFTKGERPWRNRISET